MKIFAIYAIVKITDRTGWLNDFRSRYDLEYNTVAGKSNNLYNMHITLTQPRFINNNEVWALKHGLAEYFNKNHIGKLDINFNDWHLDRQDSTSSGCIMIKSTEFDKLHNLQQQLLGIIRDNHNYIEQKLAYYENNFVPHLTIGRSLSKERFDNAVSELPNDVNISVTINNIVFSVVNNLTVDECTNSNNLNTFSLIKNI